MGKLSELLQDASRRDELIADLVEMVEEYVADRGGFRGITLRTGLAAVKRKLPDAIPRTVTRLLPEFLAALEPLHDRARARDGADFARFRSTAEHEAEEIVPGLADVLGRHL